MNRLLIFVFLTYASYAYTCAGISINEELNSKLVLEKLGEKNKYRISAPTYTSVSTDEAIIFLVYSNDETQGLHTDDEYFELNTHRNGDKTYAEFEVVLMQARPFILVDWSWSESSSAVCNGIAITEFLEVE